MTLTDEQLTAITEEARQWLRIGTESTDEEIGQTVQACLSDLSNAGVKKIDITDPLTKQAIKMYLKSHFGYDTNADRFEEFYEHLKAGMALSGDYNTEEESDGSSS